MEPAAADDQGAEPRTRTIDVVGGRNWVLTVHDGPVAALERLDAVTEGETRLGALDAAGLVAAIADEVLTDYLEVVEAIERAIDRLDDRALRGRRGDDVLERASSRSAAASRASAGPSRPQRAAFAALTRPEMALDEDFGAPWPGLTDRLDRTIDAVENLRSLLLGTFDIHMARAAKDANDVMKVLTLVSAVFLPAVVLAGVMGMNFQLAFFDDAGELLHRHRGDGRPGRGAPRDRGQARLALRTAATRRARAGRTRTRPRPPAAATPRSDRPSPG